MTPFSRRALLGAAAFLAAPAIARAQDAAPPAEGPVGDTPSTAPRAAPAPSIVASLPARPGWNRDAFLNAMRAGNRPTEISQASFDAIQARRPAALQRIERYLAARFGAADPTVLRAFAEVPREYFHYMHEGRRSTATDAYETEAKPWAVGYGSALSDYLGQAYMTQVCAPKPDHTVLEIGTGSGFQSALLSRIVAKQYSIEIIAPLGRSVAPIYAPLGYTNVETRVGDGFFGWPEVSGGFDTIIVTCAAQWVPPALLDQLKPGGQLVIPIGQPFRRGQFLYIYSKDADGRVRSRKDVGVYFIPMTGAMMNQRPPQGAPQPEPRPASPPA
ncbi:protein-L-isoaspartate O-methyltransferase family protein [Falsiroseomonas sp. HW251]|uniref:protein-L-isoaspartate O-methyltransferase family protein n=1 Tax=Falsiroseomonas sp. HW251 TaxID=3390998 RepID=UPI003D31C3F4